MVRAAWIAVLLAFVPPLSGQVTEADRFDLFTSCAPVYLLAVSWTLDVDWSLSREFAEQAVESRLQDAGIYTDRFDPDAPFLFVRASHHVSLPIIRVYVTFSKQVTDRHGGSSMVVTWERGQAPLPDGDASTALRLIAEYMDDFVSEYLRVNAEACTG